MTDLLTEAREHDLPPLWDGRAVVWEPWEYVPSGIFICPPPHPRDDVCEGCGQPRTERGFPCYSKARGFRADSEHLTHADYQAEQDARARLPQSVQHKMPRHWWIGLIAERCHHCQLDTVWDLDADTWWTLDHTDYGDAGSLPPDDPHNQHRKDTP